MRKAYITPPAIAVVTIGIESLMTGSTKGSKVFDDTDPALENETALARRRRTVWDEEEDEERDN